MFPQYDFLYSAAIFLGIGSMLFYFVLMIKKHQISDRIIDRFIIILALSSVAMLLSAQFFNTLYHYLEDPAGGWNWGGITYMGGFIGGYIAFVILYWFVFKEDRKNLLFYLNIVITGVVLAHAFGRIGCTVEGCCFGKETTSWFGIVYPEGSLASYQLTKTTIGGIDYYSSVKVIPTNLLESLFLFGLFGVLASLKKNQTIVYFISYGIWRFFIEFFRGDDRGTLIEPFTPSQFMSILFVLTGIIIIFLQHKHKTLIENRDE